MSDLSGPVLVTGANGFIGSRVVRRLVEDGLPVRCLVRQTSKTGRLDGLPVELRTGDVRDPGSLSEAAAGCRSAIHLAGISAWSRIDSPDMEPVVVGGTGNVLSAARNAGLTRLVYVSSAAALGPARDPRVRDETAPFDERASRGLRYVAAKRAAEQLCLDACRMGLEVVIVRPAEVFGPGDDDLITADNLLNILSTTPAVVCTGGTSVVHVEDVAAAIVQALARGRPGERYLLGGDNLHHRELGRLLQQTAGRRPWTVTLPGALVRAGARVAGRLRLPFPVSAALAPYATAYWFLDCAKARRELGAAFRPAAEVIGDTVRWLRETGRLK